MILRAIRFITFYQLYLFHIQHLQSRHLITNRIDITRIQRAGYRQFLDRFQLSLLKNDANLPASVIATVFSTKAAFVTG